jgi:hypothetical protein
MGGLPFTAVNTGTAWIYSIIGQGNLTVPAGAYPVLEQAPNTTTADYLSYVPGASAHAALAMDTSFSNYFNFVYEAA